MTSISNMRSLRLIASICGLITPVAASPQSVADADFPEERAALPPNGAPLWPGYASPAAITASSDGKVLFIACATANQVAAFDTEKASIVYSVGVPESPLGLALSKDGSNLYVACPVPSSAICIIDTAR